MDIFNQYTIEFETKPGITLTNGRTHGSTSIARCDYELARQIVESKIEGWATITKATQTIKDGLRLWNSEMRHEAGVPEFLC